MSDLEEQQRLMASYAPLEEGDRPEKISDVVLPDVPKMPGVKLPDDVRIGKYMDLAVTQASGVNPQCGRASMPQSPCSSCQPVSSCAACRIISGRTTTPT